MIKRFGGPELMHRLRRLEEVQAFAVSGRDKLAAKHPAWIKTDARVATLGRCVSLLTSLHLSFVFLEQSLTKTAWWNAGFLQGQIPNRKELISEFDQFAKIGFVHGLFSVIDSHLRSFLVAVDATACNGGRGEFENVRAALFARIGHKHGPDIEMLHLFRLVRNTIHNNGVYKPKAPGSQTVTYHSEQFTFSDTQLITFADWEIVLQVAEDVCEMFFRLAENPTLVAIPSIPTSAA